MTNSTTMTFATLGSTLAEDEDTWRKHTTGTYPKDFETSTFEDEIYDPLEPINRAIFSFNNIRIS